MKKRFFFLATSCLMALSLVVLSCGEQTTAPPTETQTQQQTGTTQQQTKQEPTQQQQTQGQQTQEQQAASSDQPIYGGKVSLISGEVNAFDEAHSWHVLTNTMKLTNEELWEGDWTLGPAGSGVVDFTENGARWDQASGRIAESWEIPLDGHIVINVRKGIHYSLNPDSEASRLVGGRELTAEDVVFSLKQVFTKDTSWLYRAVPVLRNPDIVAVDKYTININIAPNAVWQAGHRFFDYVNIVPPEVVAKYGDMTDWKNSVGTGPFMLTDYVPASAWTVVKNANYWQTDPIGPGKGNKLPYLNEVRFLIIPDSSTQHAALRTGKIDMLPSLSWDDTQLLTNANKNFMSKKIYSGDPRPIAMRTDIPDLPFAKKDVRRALMMAIDYNTIKDTLYHGDAQINTWPVNELAAYSDAYMPIEELPASVQELFTYNPDRAKQLLAGAGYPNGFATKILLGNNEAVIDYFSIIKDMWAKIGIDLTLDVREWNAYYSMASGRNYEEMMQGTRAPTAGLYEIPWVSSKNSSNGSFVDDAKIDAVREELASLSITDIAGAHKKFRDLLPYILEEVWQIPTPIGAVYTLWWPWLKNYHGETNIGYFNTNLWLKYAWVDQALKKSMGY